VITNDRLKRPCGAALWLLALSSILPAQDRESAEPTKRVPWTTSRISGSPEPPAPYRTEQVFSALSFTNPVTLTNAPRSERLFVVELEGKIYSFPNDNECTQADLMVDLGVESQRADHLYGFTFHPDYPETPFCYICYTVGQDIEDGTRLSRFEVDSFDPPRINPGSERLLLTWLSGGHNGGCLKFGPDGYLYISTGDGGPAFPPDPRKSGQDVSNVLSSILRIDVDHVDETLAYSIPTSNPFVGLEGARGEVWAYGFRNPWRMSFDSMTGDLWVGDVGWELWELVYRIERGANYGWSLVEGSQPVHRERTRGPTPIVAPTVQHSHIEARSITGGFVYHGARLPELSGAYVYGDYVTGKLWALRHDGESLEELVELVDSPLQIICFGVDHEEELYVVSYDGTIHRLAENAGAALNQEFPSRLSDTGLFLAVAEHEVAEGVLPYGVNAEPWMDGAVADRFIAIPGTSVLGLYDEADAQKGYLKGNWKYPADSVFMKTISMLTEPGNEASRRRLETQILHFDVDHWKAYNYLWNEDQTDAMLADDVASSATVSIQDPDSPEGMRQQAWHFASRTECILCHTARGGSIYGFNPPQLDRDFDYGGVVDNQLRVLQQVGLFEKQQASPFDKIVDPYDPSEELEKRARAYLHVNCAHCHRRGGGGTAHIELQYDWSLEKTHLLDGRPTQGTFGIHGAEVLARGDPHHSVLYYRMAKLGRGRMPYVGSAVIDRAGLQLIHDWIKDLGDSRSDSKTTEKQRDVLDRLHSATAAEALTEIKELLGSTSGALMVMTALHNGTLQGEVAQQAIVSGTEHADVQIRDLFESYLPEELRTRRLGTSVDPAEVLTMTGSVERGRELFEKGSGVQCRSCHRIGEIGQALGPDLKELAKKQNRRQMLDGILQPSKNIDPKYQALLVETTDGQVHVGLLINKDENGLILKDAQNKEIKIPADQVEFSAPQQKSLMPELLVQDMTAQELADLLAYLSAL
jgi:putative heme-binding domain-containing protein